ncbi:Uncharacterised protein [Staphylococcus intermedius NCTC 11048]|uniref:Phage protein n=1 Tax=Staphylococcus intermedius NCTC 11048 TaxID=1141106 RepID=A0A380FZ87_STAIN|nr:hypothetical protein [Staphylococcus intermedius]SUM43430.1 Uncharacterised protein [Staphylococcus intermedius NCTC 11048]
MSNTNINIEEIRKCIDECKKEEKRTLKLQGIYKEELHEAEKLIKELGYMDFYVYKDIKDAESVQVYDILIFNI